MDETDDGRYSRAPEVEDLVTLCRALEAEHARYVLIGGFAMILHGSVRGTKDIDLLVDSSSENVARIKRAMAALPDNAAAMLADDDVQTYGVVRVADEFVVDLLGKACGIDYSRAVATGVERIDVEGVAIPTATKELLIATKQTMRDHDHADVLYLRDRIAEEQRDRSR